MVTVEEMYSCASLQRKPRSLGPIARFKSSGTKQFNEMRHKLSFPVWQKRFYDRIIRSDKELDNIRQYISTNVLERALEKDNPDNIPL